MSWETPKHPWMRHEHIHFLITDDQTIIKRVSLLLLMMDQTIITRVSLLLTERAHSPCLSCVYLPQRRFSSSHRINTSTGRVISVTLLLWPSETNRNVIRSADAKGSMGNDREVHCVPVDDQCYCVTLAQHWVCWGLRRETGDGEPVQYSFLNLGVLCLMEINKTPHCYNKYTA